MTNEPTTRGSEQASAGGSPATGTGHRGSDVLLAFLSTLIVIGTLTGCASTRSAPRARPGYTERGLASWYGPGFHGRQAANGEIYDMNELTAAHRTLPFDTVVEVRNRDNGRRVVVRINDRGPFVKGRIIDLSYVAAQQLDMIGPGVAPVEIRVVRKAPGADTVTSFWVQAGAFRDPSEAQQFYRQMKKRFEDVRLTSDGAWHRVRLGPFPERKRAESTREELQRIGIDAFVVRM